MLTDQVILYCVVCAFIALSAASPPPAAAGR